MKLEKEEIILADRTECLEEFFVVTTVSVYHVKVNEGSVPSAIKIARNDEKSVPNGTNLVRCGELLGIGVCLYAFVPRISEPNIFDEDSEKNFGILVEHDSQSFTTEIVALFKTEAEAMICFNTLKLESYDMKWFDSTISMLDEIGGNYPGVVVTIALEVEEISPVMPAA